MLSCLRAWDQMSVYHYNVVDKLRLTFIGKTTEEIEKQKAFVSIKHRQCRTYIIVCVCLVECWGEMDQVIHLWLNL